MKKSKYFYATGRRKTSSARVFIKTGTGLFTIKQSKKNKHSEEKTTNQVELNKYFSKAEQVESVLSPLKVLNSIKSYDIRATIQGGGFTGQAEALRHGLARALLKVDAEYRTVLKKNGFLTRDSRMVERKKYGHHKARKSTQFSKR